MESFAETLRNDRLIKIFVGEESQPYLVTQSPLESISVYFQKAIKNEHLGPDGPGVLRFQEDDVNEWSILLYWAVKHRLPTTGELFEEEGGVVGVVAVRCCVIGEKYSVPEFRDLIMLEMLKRLEDALFHTDALKEALLTTPRGCALHRLAVDEIAARFESHTLDYEDMDHVFEGIREILGLVADAVSRWHTDQIRFNYLLPTAKKPDQQLWKKYLVDPEKTPETHWVYQHKLAR